MTNEINPSNSNQKPGKYDAVLGGQNPAPINAAVLGGIENAKNLIASDDLEAQKSGLTQMTNYGKLGLFIVYEVANDTKKSQEIRNLAQSLLISPRFSEFLPELIGKFFLENPEFLESQKMASQIKQNLQKIKTNPQITEFMDVKIMVQSTGFSRFRETGLYLVDPLGIAKAVGESELEEYQTYLAFKAEFEKIMENLNILKKQNESNKPNLFSKLFTKKTEPTLNWKGRDSTQADFQQEYEKMSEINNKYDMQNPIASVYSDAQGMENSFNEILFPQILQVLEIKKKSQRTLIQPHFITEFSGFIYSHTTRNPESFYIKPSDLIRELEELLDRIIEPKVEDFMLNILG